MTHEASLSRKLSNYLVITVFALGLGLPTVDRLFQIDPSLRLKENRVMATAPNWPSTKQAVSEFPQKFDAYWNDNFGLRRLLIRCNAWVRYQLGVSATPLIVVGKDNWLFYTGESALESHQGTRRLSDLELQAWRDELQARHDWMERRKIHYLLVFTPDKQSTYPEALPSHLARTATSTTTLDQLMTVLSTHSTVNVLDLRQPIAQAKEKGEVFWRTDSHWNDSGAYVGYREILRRAQQWYPVLEAIPESQFKANRWDVWSGDLAEMLGLVGRVVETRVELEPLFPWSAQAASTPGDAPAGSSRYSAWEGPSSLLPRAVIFHDSYFLAASERNASGRIDAYSPPDSKFHFARLLAGHFSRSVFSWQLHFDATFVEREKPDIVIQELVERVLVRGPLGKVPRE